jgi:hypothetical protein
VTVRLRVVAIALMVGLQAAAVAFAQSSASNKAAAEGLFDQGLALLRESRFREACMRLEQSQALDHGIGTMMYLADCYDHLGRTASAWALFREAASEASAGGQSDRARMANERAAELGPRLAKLVVETTPGGVVPGLTYALDGGEQPAGMWGVSVPIDPGEHQVVAHAPGYDSLTITTQVLPEQTSTVIIPKLQAHPTVTAADRPPAIEPAARPLVARAPAKVPPVRAGGHRRSKLTRALTFGLGSAGVLALVAGTGLGIRAIVQNNEAKDFCPGGGSECADQRGVDATNHARTAAKLANPLVIGGALLAVAGVTVWFYHPWEEAPRLALKTDGRSAQLSLGGTF